MIAPMGYEHILVETEPPIATVTLNRPKVLNALGPAAIGEAAAALGGGCEVALMCDLIVAGDTARLGQPEVNLGIIPGAGGTQRWPRTAGKHVAMEVMLTGAPVTAQRAYELGIVNKVVPAEMTIE